MRNSSAMLKSLEQEAHIWFSFIEKQFNQRISSFYEKMLSEQERKKLESYHFENHRQLYLISHALVRTVLSNYVKKSPENWVFSYNAFGRPEIRRSEGDPNLRFNLSRTNGLAACIVVLSFDAGIDVENTSELDDLTTLSEYVLTPNEIARLRSLPKCYQKKRFFRFWTLKEAYVKARGDGLSLPLASFGFNFDDQGYPNIYFTKNLKDSSSDWQFAYLSPSSSHAVAVAIRRKDREDLGIKVFKNSFKNDDSQQKIK